MSILYAHSLPGKPRETWEPLSVHLQEVAELAGGFAEAFGAAKLAEAAGWWHDLGKATRAFQEGRLEVHLDESLDDQESQGRADVSANDSKRRRVDHATAGTRHAIDQLGLHLGRLIAYGIAGHHGRLPDYGGDGSKTTLKARLDPRGYPIESPAFPPGIADAVAARDAVPTTFGPGHQPPSPFQTALLTRMLYSALIDADRLATQRFYEPALSALRLRPDSYRRRAFAKIR